MPADAGDDGEDPVIRAERAHLVQSREFLRLMREDVLAINPMAGDPVSLEFLKADLYRRAESLRDLPDAPLFFGRVNYAADTEFDGSAFHVGRRHVHDEDGTPVVIDWRAPVSRPFYRASQGEPMGLLLRRRFGFSGATGPPQAPRIVQGKKKQASCCWLKSSGHARVRCVTSSPRSSRTRTRSSGETPARRSACRARQGRERPRSVCTGSLTCCTRTRNE
jgi:hypothetical protein